LILLCDVKFEVFDNKISNFYEFQRIILYFVAKVKEKTMVNKRFWLVISVMVLVFGMTVVGCDDGSTSSSGGDNVFTISGKTYGIVGGEMMHYGHYYSTSANNVDLVLFSEDVYIYFEMFVPVANNRLVAGTYSLSQAANEDFPPFTYAYGATGTEDFDYSVTGGTVQVSVSGSGNNAVYTITIDCTLINDDTGAAAGTMKGTYKGTLDWEDESIEPWSILPQSNKVLK